MTEIWVAVLAPGGGLLVLSVPHLLVLFKEGQVERHREED